MKDDEFKIIKETYERITIRRGGEYPYTGHQQKLLCIGGPFDGQRKAGMQLGEEVIIDGRYTKGGYWQYNRGEYRPKGTPNKAVYIHESVLKFKL